MIASGNPTVSLQETLKKVSEGEILAHYLGVHKVPTIINSPLRQDKKPSFGLYSSNGKRINFIDFSTKERGGLFDLLMKLWNCNFTQALEKIDKEMITTKTINIEKRNPCKIYKSSKNSKNELQCKIRRWKDYDIEYWKSYGISLEWLKYAEVFPISHIIILKNNEKFIIGADKYAYSFVERKEDNTTLKIYQPFNTKGYKWANKHDGSVISLWTKIPANGNIVVVCSSLKDALCLSCNTKIPAIAVQGEGYSISNTAINNLKKRFKNIYILFDNDKTGIIDGEKLAKETGFTNLVLPPFEGGKDISDAYKVMGKDKFLKFILPLFNINS